MKKIALITGATSGIGEASARRFAEGSYNLIPATHQASGSVIHRDWQITLSSSIC